MPLSKEAQQLIAQNMRLINYRKAQICTQAGALSGAGNPKTGAEAGKIWVVAQGNHMAIQAYNAIALDMTLGVWVMIADDRISGEAEITQILVAENAHKGGDNYVALVAKGPRSSETDIKVNWNATATPTINDDATLGYSKYSLWIYNSIAYICIDPTAAAAVWKRISGMAPPDATYIVQTASSDLSAEQAMGALATGLVKNTTTTGVQSIAVAGTDYLKPIVVKNTSGTTAAAQDVGYINGSNEYKTTTTANDPNMVTGGCVVTTGGANNADIEVRRRGRVTLKLNGNCSIGDKLFSSTTAGQASVSTTMRPEMFAIAQTANAGGAGGTCEALLYTNTAPSFVTDANDILRVDNHSTTDFVALINAGGGGGLTATNVPYDTISAGAENVIKPQVATHLGKMRLYNSTRSNYRLIESVNTTTDVITTVSSSDDWADNDSITIVSPTVTTGAANKAIEVDMTQASIYPALTRAMIIDYTEYDAAAGGVAGAVHPLETYSGQKDSTNYTQRAATPAAKGDINMPMLDNAFTFYSEASGAGTKITVLRVRGFFVAAP